MSEMFGPEFEKHVTWGCGCVAAVLIAAGFLVGASAASLVFGLR